MDTATNDLSRVEARLDALTGRVDLLLERNRAFSELIDESGPILDAMMKAGTERLGDLESRGVFSFGVSMLRLLERVATSYSAEDVDQLGDAMVGILDTVRNVTQPEVLAVANEATEALHQAEDLKPVGVMGALKRSRDQDVQQGLAVMLEVLRQVGRASTAAGSGGQPRLARVLAPRREVRPVSRAPAPRRPAPASSPAPPRPRLAPAVELSVPGFELDGEGFLVDPSTWTEDFARAIAAQLGIDPMTDDHWTVVRWMREEFLENGASPNIRKVAKNSGIGTRAIYQLFKKAPGKTAARIGGIPKPVGCI